MKAYTIALTTLLALAPGVALAHTGGETGLAAGFLHPLTGLDHLLAMFAIGIWAAMQQGKMQLALPTVFVFALLAGFGAAVAGLALPMVETGIALSVVVLGTVIFAGSRLPAAAVLGFGAIFAVFHGFAHGAEASGSLLSFGVGFIATSAALHLSGALVTRALAKLPMLIRSAGAAIAASGVLMFA
ncbi:HupE/UreJ family protein [Marinobacterium litorale]|uniref:HupE/UreJ family protein n=1 Tax=Marinobacterium litorale TaxID=404770 RepID=UPI000423FFE0|nr:HupE/UreJ family protein [Marinobacterium litorale]